MAIKTFKLTLDESDVAYFRDLYRAAKKRAAEEDPLEIIDAAKKLIKEVRSAPRRPKFVDEAVTSLEDLLQMVEDEDYALPQAVKQQAVTALAYFANPEDMIPDHIPGLGFLDDAIMIKIVEEEFKHELWAYRKFRSFRAGAEQRPWTAVAKDRLPKRLAAYRKQLRAKVAEKKASEASRGRMVW
jgi:uncharacterized membrane protein YkvA (DUF1232 family)